MMRLLLAAGFLVLSIAAPTWALDKGAALLALVDSDRDENALLAELEARKVRPTELAEALRQFRPMVAPFTGLRKFEIEAPDGRKTTLHVYVPKNYRGDRPWPCILALHGLGAKGSQMIEVCSRIADRWGYILVAPSAKKFKGMLPLLAHWWKYTDDGFALAALDWAFRHFTIDEDRVLITGYSMGGFGTWNIALRFPDRFFAMAPFAGGISRAEYVGLRDVSRRRLLPNGGMLYVLFAHGTADGVVPVKFDQRNHKDLKKAGVDHVYREIPNGRHLLPEIIEARHGDWKKAHVITELFDALKDRRRAGLDGSFRFVSLNASDATRWVRFEGVSPCEIHGESDEKGFRITVKNIRKVTVMLDGLGRDLAQPVRVHLQDRKVHDAVVKPDLLTVIRSWRRFRDRSRVFVASIPLEVPEEKPEKEEGY